MNLASTGSEATHRSHSPEKVRKRAGININGACEGCRRGKRKVDRIWNSLRIKDSKLTAPTSPVRRRQTSLRRML